MQKTAVKSHQRAIKAAWALGAKILQGREGTVVHKCGMSLLVSFRRLQLSGGVMEAAQKHRSRTSAALGSEQTKTRVQSCRDSQNLGDLGLEKGTA